MIEDTENQNQNLNHSQPKKAEQISKTSAEPAIPSAEINSQTDTEEIKSVEHETATAKATSTVAIEPKTVSIADTEEGIEIVETLKDKDFYDPKEFEELSKLYEQSLREIKEGELVRGRIVAISDKEIAVDIGFKAEGTIPTEEFDDPDSLHIGDEIVVFLDKVEDQEGQLVLSKRKADFMATWERMLKIYETKEVIRGLITRRIKGGMVVDLNGIDAFLPGSQIDIHPVRDFDALVGQEMDFRIVKINELRKNIVLSHKVLIEESLADIREKILLEMDVGAIMEGTVKNITDFGVFVDLGGVDGLLHITDLSWGRINHPSEAVKLDDKITIKIIDFDPVRKRVSIGYKQLLPHPWEGVEERYPIGKKVTGKVVSITNYGAFIELEKGVEGLIHVSEMSWTQHIKHPSALLSIGDEVEAVVLSMDVKERKISLGIKQIEPDPWETLEQKYAVNSHHKGIVRELVPFGAFVELEDGIEGLVHISDLSWTKKVRHPAEVVKKGQEIEVIILGFDRNERRIALGYKQIQESPWDKLESMYAVGTLTQGKVVRLIDKGVIVELPEGVEGFVPNSQLGRDDEGSIRKRLNLDDMLNLAVVEFEKEAKRIVLSAVEARKKMEQSEYKKYMEAKKETEEQAVTEVPQEAAKIVPPTETLLTVEEIIETPTPKKRAPKKKRPPKEKAKTRVEPKTEVTAETPSEPLIEKKAEKPAKKVKKPKPVEKGAPIIAAEAEGLTSPIETEPIKEKSPKKQLAKKKAKSKITNDAITSVEANEKEAESKEISPSAKLEEKTTSIEQK